MTTPLAGESVIQEAEKVSRELLERLMLSQVQVAAELQPEGGVKLNLAIGEEAGIVIGYHGEGLLSLQTLLALILYRRTGEWRRVRIDIDGYLERRHQQLQQLAQEAVTRVLETGKSETLPYLSGNERRIIHELLSSDERVVTESFGEEQERRLVISPK